MTDQQIIDYASNFRQGILQGRPSSMTCAMVCWPLETLLNFSGVKCRAVETVGIEIPEGTINHVWLKLEDGRALDPTYDQFGTDENPLPKVYLGEPTRFHRE